MKWTDLFGSDPGHPLTDDDQHEVEVEQLRAALNVALAYATGVLPPDEPTREAELAGAREVLFSTGRLGRLHTALAPRIPTDG